MKTRLYTIFTGLLMAACITSYGQEIVSEFHYTCGKAFSYNDLVTCSNGSILSGIYCIRSNSNESTRFHVCKFSPDGQLLDSVTFASGWELYETPGMPDTFVLPDYRINDSDSTLDITMTFIDADLTILSTTATPIHSGFDPQSFLQDYIIISPTGDIIVTYWIGETFYLTRIGLNGTLKAHVAAPGVLPANMTYMPSVDSSLNYESFGIFDETNEHFYTLGGYITDESEPWPLIAYIFDSKLSLIDTIVYCNLDESHYCDYGSREHIIPLKDGTSMTSRILAANIHFPDDTFSTSLIKLDIDNNPIAFTAFEYGSYTYGNTPINTVVTENNQIYHTYLDYANGYYNPEIHLTHLDEDLNIVWNISLPRVPNALTYGNTLKVLPNNDIAVSVASLTGSFSKLYVFIIHDNDLTSTPEIVATETPFELYPNPVKDLLTLRFDDGAEPESVELYDLAGRLVGTKPNGLESIDMEAMPSGVYMLRVTTKDGTSYHEKIVKE